MIMAKTMGLPFGLGASGGFACSIFH